MWKGYHKCVQTLTSADAPAGWTRPPSRGDKSRRSLGPEKQRNKCVRFEFDNMHTIIRSVRENQQVKTGKAKINEHFTWGTNSGSNYKFNADWLTFPHSLYKNRSQGMITGYTVHSLCSRQADDSHNRKSLTRTVTLIRVNEQWNKKK